MATTTEQIDGSGAPLEPGPPTDEEEEERGNRRLLIFLLALLGVAAIFLLALLLWLLRPESEPEPGQVAGYPIDVVTTIYGYGDGPDEFVNWPLGVAFDEQGNVWISNTGEGRAEQYTSEGGYIRSVGVEDDFGKLYAPYGLVVDPARDALYVADPRGRAVQIYTASTGAYIGHLPADDQDLKVFGDEGFTPFDVGLAGGRVVVSSNDGLYFFDANGNVVSRWGGTFGRRDAPVRGSGLGMFNFPDSFTTDPATGRVYVADTLNRRVIALGSEGRWLWVSGRPDKDGKITSFWQLPRGIAVGPDGNVYVIDTFRPDPEGMGTGHFVVLSPDGELLSEFGRNGSDTGSFRFPEQLARGPEGLWAIADRENDRVVIFRLITPYPEVTDLYAGRYPKTFEDLTGVAIWSTPQPDSKD